MTKSQYITDAILNRGLDLDQAMQAWKDSALERTKSMYQLVYAFRHQGSMSRKEVVERAAQLSGYSVATAGSFYNAMDFAIEYHRQELRHVHIITPEQAAEQLAKWKATEQGE